MEQWPSIQDAGFAIQEYKIQNHWVAPRSTHSFIIPTLIKWVSGTPGDLVVKSKQCHRSDSVAFRQLNQIHKKGHEAFVYLLNKHREVTGKHSQQNKYLLET